MPAGRASRTWPVRFDGDAKQQALEFDLRRYEGDSPARAVAREAVTRFEANGVPEVELARCSEHGRDGTNLKGLKVYLPRGEPKPRFRMVFFAQLHDGSFELLYLAFGVAHPPHALERRPSTWWHIAGYTARRRGS